MPSGLFLFNRVEEAAVSLGSFSPLMPLFALIALPTIIRIFVLAPTGVIMAHARSQMGGSDTEVTITGGSGFIGNESDGNVKRAGIAVLNLATRPPRCDTHLDVFVKSDVMVS